MKYTEIIDLKIIELYQKIETKPAVVRIKAKFNLDDAIPLGFYVPVSEIELQWIPFRYEYLPIVCYRCGLVGHHQKDCHVVLIKEENQLTVEGNRAVGYNNKMRITPKDLDDKDILLLSFPNSSEYV